MTSPCATDGRRESEPGGFSVEDDAAPDGGRFFRPFAAAVDRPEIGESLGASLMELSNFVFIFGYAHLFITRPEEGLVRQSDLQEKVKDPAGNATTEFRFSQETRLDPLRRGARYALFWDSVTISSRSQRQIHVKAVSDKCLTARPSDDNRACLRMIRRFDGGLGAFGIDASPSAAAAFLISGITPIFCVAPGGCWSAPFVRNTVLISAGVSGLPFTRLCRPPGSDNGTGEIAAAPLVPPKRSV